MSHPHKAPRGWIFSRSPPTPSSRILPAPSPRCLQPPGPARDSGVRSGDGAEAKAESEESEAVEAASWPQVSEQKRRPRWQVSGCPRSALRQRLQHRQDARACQCSPWCVTSSLSAPAEQPRLRERLFFPVCQNPSSRRLRGLASPGERGGGSGLYRWGPRKPGTVRQRGSRSSPGSRAGRSSSRSAARAGARRTPGSRNAPGASAGPRPRCTPP